MQPDHWDFKCEIFSFPCSGLKPFQPILLLYNQSASFDEEEAGPSFSYCDKRGRDCSTQALKNTEEVATATLLIMAAAKRISVDAAIVFKSFHIQPDGIFTLKELYAIFTS